MAKLILEDVTNIGGNPTSAAVTLNANSLATETAFENTLSRDGTAPNQMLADFDLNHNDILNGDVINTDRLLINGTEVFVSTDLTTATGVDLSEDNFVGNGGQVAYTLSRTPGAEENVLVWVGGAIQDTSQFTISGTTLTLDTAPASGVKIRVVVVTQVAYSEFLTLRDETVAAAAEVSGVISGLYFKSVADATALAALSTTQYEVAITKDKGFIWVLKLGDYSASVTADTQQNSFVAATDSASTVKAWVRVSPVIAPLIIDRAIRFDRYRAKYATDDLALRAMFFDAFSTSVVAESAWIDLCGTQVSIDGPMDISTITGRTTNYKTVTIHNGTIIPTAGSTLFVDTVYSRNCTTVQGSAVVTVASTTGLEVGMGILDTGATFMEMPDGICRESYITAIDSGANTITMNTGAYRSRTAFSNFVKFPYFFTFKGFTVGSRIKFMNLTLRCSGGIASGIQMAQDGNDWLFFNIHALEVGQRLITDWNSNSSGCQVSHVTAWSYDNSEGRTSMGVTMSSADAKMIACRLINFRHSFVGHSSGYIITNCHNWQGSSTAISRQPAYVFTLYRPFASITNCYIDNGGIMQTNENNLAATGITGDFSDLTVTGNVFTMSTAAQSTDRYIKLHIAGYGADTGAHKISGWVVTGNVFRRLVGTLPAPNIPKVEELVIHGSTSLDTENISEFYWKENTFRGITYPTTSHPTLAVTKLAGAEVANWEFDFTNKMPFSLHPLRVTSLVAGGRDSLKDATATVVAPGWSTKQGSNNYKINAVTTVAVSGTVTMTVDCNLTD